MKNRHPLAVLLLPFVTFGIYSWYWLVSTKNEMNKMGEHVPTAWIWLIPFFGGLWWYWKYSEGVDHVTKEKMPFIAAFLLFLFLGAIGHAIIQYYFNQIGVSASPATSAPATPPPSPVQQTQKPAAAVPTEAQSPQNNNQ